jgi:PAS domain S-box-containing protein
LSGQTSVAIEIALHNALLFSDVRIGRDRLAAVLNSVDEGIALIETNGYVTLVNEGLSHIIGWPQSEFIAQPFSSYPPDILARLGYTNDSAQQLLDRLAQEGSIDLENFTFTIDSPLSVRYFERSIVPVPNQEDGLGGWLIILRDITEQHQLQKTRDLISETLVHDLRSPVSAVLGAIDVVDDLITNNQSLDLAQQSITIARRSAQRVLGMIESMLEIARLQSGKIELNLIPVNVHSLITHSISEFVPLAREYKITLQNDVPTDLPQIFIDHHKINRVISNLLDNALKFTPDQGIVYVAAIYPGKDQVEIQVSDTGPGIPEEYRDKIFERFSQLPEQRGRRRGSGLGLTFCKLAVEAHGGRIWVEPNRPQGSTFIITLPIHNPDQASSPV